jgi:hypothetical protein
MERVVFRFPEMGFTCMCACVRRPARDSGAALTPAPGLRWGSINKFKPRIPAPTAPTYGTKLPRPSDDSSYRVAET